MQILSDSEGTFDCNAAIESLWTESGQVTKN